MEELLDFFRRLDDNNNRDWFDAHRSEWTQVKQTITTLAEALIAGISTFDPSVGGLRPQDCTYRIARDTRFSKDKSPYKNWVGVYVAPHGKKSGYAGYYLHIAPNHDRLVGEHSLWAGLYCPEPVVMRSVREEILDNGAELVRNIRKASGFRLDRSDTLKRTPVGFPTGTEHDDLLRLKQWGIEKSLTEDFLLQPNLAERAVAEFRRTAPFVAQLNRAVQYAFVEMR